MNILKSAKTEQRKIDLPWWPSMACDMKLHINKSLKVSKQNIITMLRGFSNYTIWRIFLNQKPSVENEIQFSSVNSKNEWFLYEKFCLFNITRTIQNKSLFNDDNILPWCPAMACDMKIQINISLKGIKAAM